MTARTDGPWLRPTFSLIQAGIRMTEETKRHVELMASASKVSGEPRPVTSESESESDHMVVEIASISYDWSAQVVRSVRSQHPPGSIMIYIVPLVGSEWMLHVVDAEERDRLRLADGAHQEDLNQVSTRLEHLKKARAKVVTSKKGAEMKDLDVEKKIIELKNANSSLHKDLEEVKKERDDVKL